MAVFVDILRPARQTHRGLWKWETYGHLMSDSRDELLIFARILGLKASYGHGKGYRFHFDLTKNMRQKAIKLGAIELDSIEFKNFLRVAKSNQK